MNNTDTEALKERIVAAHASVARGERGARQTLERLQAEFRSGHHSVVRDYFGPGAVQLKGGSAVASGPVRAPKREIEDWVLGADEAFPFGRPYTDVELRDRGFVNYKVTLFGHVRQDIVDEIRRVHRAAGKEVEVGGWLFAHYLPKPSSDSIEIVHATWAGEGASSSRTTIFMGDPISVMAEVHAAGLGHLRLVGDWHSHCVRGSELPSQQDAIAWAGTMDSLAAREAYVSLVVAPKTTATAGRCPCSAPGLSSAWGSPRRRSVAVLVSRAPDASTPEA
jgi:hypothetical protein